MKSLIVFLFCCCLCLGCSDNVEKPIEVDVHVDVHHPIAKFVTSVPSTDSILYTGDTIALHFTEAPEMLQLQVVRHGGPYSLARFEVHIQEYNGNKTPTCVLIPNGFPIEIIDIVLPVRLKVSWTHGYKELDFDVKIRSEDISFVRPF